LGAWGTTILVDSMQIYREIPAITNQARERPAELAGLVSVAEEWTVASHKRSAETIIDSLPEELPFVLDAGTGMYLNAIILDVPLAPKVPREVRAEAEKLAFAAENPRREARRLELELSGASERGSIWDGIPRYNLALAYLRPPRQDLDRNILARSSRIVRDGAEEAERLAESGIVPNQSVRGAIGVKEMLLRASGDLSAEQAEEAIATRTRRLARRQIRWFDKLSRTLRTHRPANGETPARVLVLENPDQNTGMNLMHDIMKR
jgi:tRNA dimethylallyltransferase